MQQGLKCAFSGPAYIFGNNYVDQRRRRRWKRKEQEIKDVTQHVRCVTCRTFIRKKIFVGPERNFSHLSLLTAHLSQHLLVASGAASESGTSSNLKPT